MKHAILILAHKNIGLLCRLAGYFEKDCDVFIHIDKKQPVTREEEEKLRSYKQVKAVLKYVMHASVFREMCILWLLIKRKSTFLTRALLKCWMRMHVSFR